MIPLCDAHSTRSVSVMTYLVMALNVAAFAYQRPLAPDLHARLIEQYGLVPNALVALHVPDTLLAPISSLFLHGSWPHLILNAWFLWIFARTIEDLLGKARFVLFYLAVGLTAAAVQVAVDPSSLHPVIGASGAIAGVLAAYLRLSPRGRVVTAVPLGFVFMHEVSAVVFIVLWFVLQLAGGFVSLVGPAPSGVAFFANAGGFLGGLWLGAALRPAPNATLGFRRPEFY